MYNKSFYRERAKTQIRHSASSKIGKITAFAGGSYAIQLSGEDVSIDHVYVQPGMTFSVGNWVFVGFPSGIHHIPQIIGSAVDLDQDTVYIGSGSYVNASDNPGQDDIRDQLTTVFYDNFDVAGSSPSLNNWDTDDWRGTWQTAFVGGTLGYCMQQTDNTQAWSLSRLGERWWGDVSVDCQIRIDSACAGQSATNAPVICIHSENWSEDNSKRYEVHWTEDNILLKKRWGNTVTVLGTYTYDRHTDDNNTAWQYFKVRCIGKHVQVFFDNQYCIDVVDSGDISRYGELAFATKYVAASFDNIQVKRRLETGKSEPTTDTKPLKPNGLQLYGGTGNTIEWTGRDCRFIWKRASATVGAGREEENAKSEGIGMGAGRESSGAGEGVKDFVKMYKVEIWRSSVKERWEYVPEPAYTYTYEKNVEDFGTAVADFEIRIYSVSDDGLLSDDYATISVDNPSPSSLSDFSTSVSHATVKASWEPNVEVDLDYYEVYMDQNTGFTPAMTNRVYQGLSTDVVIDYDVGAEENVRPNRAYYLKSRSRDTFGNYSDYTSETIALTTSILSINAETGDQTVLSEGGLRYYPEGKSDGTWYVQRIAAGEAYDGDTVDLTALSPPFSKTPSVFLSPRKMRVYDNGTNEDQYLSIYPTNVSETSFGVNAKLMTIGTEESGSPEAEFFDAHGEDSISGSSKTFSPTIDISDVSIKFKVRAHISAYFTPGSEYSYTVAFGYCINNPIASIYRMNLNYSLNYRTQGVAGYSTYATYTQRKALNTCTSASSQWNDHIVGLTLGKYDIQVTLNSVSQGSLYGNFPNNWFGNPGYYGEFMLRDWDASGDQELVGGTVSWIAFEGGDV